MMKRYNRMAAIYAICVLTSLMLAIMLRTGIAAPEASSIEQSFRNAEKEYLHKNLQSAAGHVEKAASYMKTEAEKASDKGRDALAASAEELRKLAEDVKSGAVKSKKQLEDAFARAHLALASEAHVRATESWAQKESAKAGAFLESAGRHLEKSLTWAGRQAEKGTQNVTKKTKDLARKMKAKGALAADEVGKGLKETGMEIEKFGKRISP